MKNLLVLALIMGFVGCAQDDGSSSLAADESANSIDVQVEEDESTPLPLELNNAEFLIYAAGFELETTSKMAQYTQDKPTTVKQDFVCSKIFAALELLNRAKINITEAIPALEERHQMSFARDALSSASVVETDLRKLQILMKCGA